MKLLFLASIFCPEETLMACDPDVIEFARGMPKAELHVHIEGTLEPELIYRLASRNEVTLPWPDVDALRSAYAFTDLQSFLDVYYAGASVLREEADFYEMGRSYLARADADHVAHAEIFFDPQTHTARGVPMAHLIEGLHRACVDAERESGISTALILCFLRHLSEEDAFAALAAAQPWLDRIIGVGLDSSELGHPPAKFERVFARARELGLRRVAHAGEEGPPKYIWQALKMLDVERVDHGVRCLEDPALVAHLAKMRMPLTVCPLSNLKLCVVDDLARHPMRKLLHAGLCATVNSDDPAYFGGYLNENLIQTAQALSLTADEVEQLARNSFEASFASDSRRADLIARLDSYVQKWKANNAGRIKHGHPLDLGDPGTL